MAIQQSDVQCNGGTLHTCVMHPQQPSQESQSNTLSVLPVHVPGAHLVLVRRTKAAGCEKFAVTLGSADIGLIFSCGMQGQTVSIHTAASLAMQLIILADQYFVTNGGRPMCSWSV